jgi:hypothetical protein
MDFKSDVQKQVYDRVKPWLEELFGDVVRPREDLPAFGVRKGSGYVTVYVWPWGESEAYVLTRSYVVAGAGINEELLKFLLQKNTELTFGAFGLDEDNDILFEHSIVGSCCDRDELLASVNAVLHAADTYDDEIVARWGGRCAIESTDE